MLPHLRVARPVTDLERAAALYTAGLGWTRLGHFVDHQGFDGVMLGVPSGAWHVEFTLCRTHPVQPTPTPEDLLVMYVPDKADWERQCERMLSAGFRQVKSLNPYWEQSGRTFVDHDGYRVVLQCAAWVNEQEGADS